MSTATVSLIEIAAEWRTARRLYPFYSALIREFQLEVPHCKELEHPVDRAEREVLDRIQNWFDEVDRKVHVAQMRQLLQNMRFGEEDLLRALLLRHLPQNHQDENLRDKLDYLLVQYFAAVAPHHPHDGDVTSAEVCDALQPVLGHVQTTQFAWSKELEKIAEGVDRCGSLSELLASGLVELGRKTKTTLGEEYFLPEALIEITRFNFRLRLGFFRLMHSDLHAIRQAIHELETLGIKTIDCREAGLSAEEPMATIRSVCHQWKKPFREAYRAGQSFRQLGLIRNTLAKAVVAHCAQKNTAQDRVATNGVSSQSAAPAPTNLNPVEPVSASMPAESVEQVIDTISEQLFASKQKSKVCTVHFGNEKQILASWEVNAFVRGGDPFCLSIQRGVAARCLLAHVMSQSPHPDRGALAQALDTAHMQAASMQEQVAKAKDAGDIDSAVSLAATAKRLLAVIEHAEKLKS